MASLKTLLAALVLAPAVAAGGDLAKGVAFYQEGKWAEAEAELRGVPGSEACAHRAAALVRLERYEEAEAEARSVLAEAATQPMAVAALGESLVKQAKLDEAVDKMTAALAAKADLAYAYYWRGQSRQRKQQIARMVEDYQSFLHLVPDAPEAAALRALLAGMR
jgi:tetratricopeptide (TPR) repeat protein